MVEKFRGLVAADFWNKVDLSKADLDTKFLALRL
jgi:hypothetical protein